MVTPMIPLLVDSCCDSWGIRGGDGGSPWYCRAVVRQLSFVCVRTTNEAEPAAGGGFGDMGAR